MSNFVALWVYLSGSPLFGLTLTLGVYALAHAFYQKHSQAPLLNPVLWSILFVSCVLYANRTPYETYFAGAQFIHFLLGPAVVALAWPMWERRHQIIVLFKPLVISAAVAGIVGAFSAVSMAWAFGLPDGIVRSIAPKSVTAPVAMGIAEQLHGIPAMAAVFSVLTGLIGATTAPFIFQRIGSESIRERGFALGTASHGIGAARAMQVNSEAGAFAGLALGLQVVLTSLLGAIYVLFDKTP